MLTNIRGLVDRLDLAPSKGLMPLFEAVSNAMDAIEDKFGGPSGGSITIRLLAADDIAAQGGGETLITDGFEVADNGVGFNDANISSFGEAYTLSKVNLGGKGVGRFTFLKVFRHCEIRSVYEDGGKHFSRNFTFSITEELNGANVVSATSAPTGTILRVC
jgi:hypothetical protein